MLLQSKNEWQDNLSLIVLSKLVLYIHISSFRVRFYERKAKWLVSEFSSLLSSSNVHKSRARGVQRVPSQDAVLCDYGLFNHTFAQNVLQSITSWQIVLRLRRMRRLCLRRLTCQLLRRNNPRRELSPFRAGDICISISNQPLHTPLPHNYNHDRTYAYQKGVE